MKRYTEGEIRKVLREKFTPARGTSQTQAAAKLGFSVQYVQAVLAGSRPITAAMASALGFRVEPTIYVKVRP